MNLEGPGDLTAEVTINSTLPLGCDCCSIWEDHGQCKLYLDIVADTQIIGSTDLVGHHCKFELSRTEENDVIPIVARKRVGTSSGTFHVPFKAISILFDQNDESIWEGYTPPSIQVIIKTVSP